MKKNKRRCELLFSYLVKLYIISIGLISCSHKELNEEDVQLNLKEVKTLPSQNEDADKLIIKEIFNYYKYKHNADCSYGNYQVKLTYTSGGSFMSHLTLKDSSRSFFKQGLFNTSFNAFYKSFSKLESYDIKEFSGMTESNVNKLVLQRDTFYIQNGVKVPYLFIAKDTNHSFNFFYNSDELEQMFYEYHLSSILE